MLFAIRPVNTLNSGPSITSNSADRMTDPALDADERTDLDLIARWKGGDQRSATLLVDRHAPAVARFAASLGAKGDVQELVQDTFVRAFASLDTYRGDSSLRTWLFTIAKRLLLDRRRSERRRGERPVARSSCDHAGDPAHRSSCRERGHSAVPAGNATELGGLAHGGRGDADRRGQQLAHRRAPRRVVAGRFRRSGAAGGRPIFYADARAGRGRRIAE